jgi:predicted RNA-binding protein with PUA-like domain
MKINDLKRNAEDIQPVENEQIQGTEETSIEQDEEMNKFMLELTKNRFKSVLRALKVRMNKGITLEEIIQEIKEKRSSLSANQRLFVQSFKPEFIQQLLND